MSDDRREIEIIPPGQEPRDDYAASGRIWISTGGGEVKFVKLGPFGALMLGLGMLAVIGLGFFFLTSLFLILVPVMAALGVGAYLAGLVGAGPFRRLR
jgi:hypothetical protein